MQARLRRFRPRRVRLVEVRRLRTHAVDPNREAVIRGAAGPGRGGELLAYPAALALSGAATTPGRNDARDGTRGGAARAANERYLTVIIKQPKKTELMLP